MSGPPKKDSIAPTLGGIDGGWDEVAPPDPTANPTLRPPPPASAEPMILGEEHEVHDDDEVHVELDLDPVEPKIDIAAASRAANTAAALGRAPKPHTTLKMQAFQLAEALARSTASDEEDDTKKR